MNREGHNEVQYFIGNEVEHSPAFSKKTLFVVGYQDTNEIEKLARKHKTPHIFLGANHSFDAAHPTDYFNKTWNDQITHLLDKGFWVTLDYQAHQHETVLKMFTQGVWQSRLFIPMLSVRIPHIETSSANLTIKIDDIDFKATNRGVWTHHFHSITDSNRFTDWQDYATDETVSTEPPKVFNVEVDDKTETKNVKVIVSDDVVKGSEDNGIDVEAEITAAIKNDAVVGLDTDGKSKLKAENEEEVTTETKPQFEHATTESTAEAYAEGAKEDPLGKSGSTKKQKIKTSAA